MKTRATFYIEENLLKRLRVQAATKGQKASDLVSEAIEKIVTVTIEQQGKKVFLSGPTISRMQPDK